MRVCCWEEISKISGGQVTHWHLSCKLRQSRKSILWYICFGQKSYFLNSLELSFSISQKCKNCTGSVTSNWDGAKNEMKWAPIPPLDNADTAGILIKSRAISDSIRRQSGATVWTKLIHAGNLVSAHQWHVPTTVLWWVTGARWVSGATCCSRFHPPGACDFDTNGWWVSGATSAADSVILLTDDQQKETLESSRGKPVHSLVIS